MLLVTGGFPYSGKTEFVKQFVQKAELVLRRRPRVTPITEIIKIEPKEFYPVGYDRLPQESQTAIATSAWEVCHAKTEELISTKPNNTLIIFDTAAKRLMHMHPLFVKAQTRGHFIAYAFVAASAADCKRRAGSRWNDQFEDDYAHHFAITVPTLRKLSDLFVLIKNDDDPARTAIKAAVDRVVNEAVLRTSAVLDDATNPVCES